MISFFSAQRNGSSWITLLHFPKWQKSRPKPNPKFERFEEILCATNLTHHPSLEVHNCPKHGIVTTDFIGELGNTIWEYASVWAVARTTGLLPYVPRCMRNRLDKLFESLTVPTLEQIIHCPFNINSFVDSHKDWNYLNDSIYLPLYAQLPELVVPWMQDLRKEFTFKKELTDKAYRILQQIKKTNKDYEVFIGVHVRRTDYFHHLKVVNNITKWANHNYFFKAMKYFEKKYSSVVFVVVSDDPEWCLKVFRTKGNVYVVSNKSSSPAQDMAIMSICNHSLIDYGTFGQWGAFLAGGETVYFKSEPILDQIAYMLPNWHFKIF